MKRVGSSLQDTVYHILPKLKLRRIFSTVYFVKQTFHKREFKFEKELSKLPSNIPNIFKTLNINCYIERPSATFYNENIML